MKFRKIFIYAAFQIILNRISFKNWTKIRVFAHRTWHQESCFSHFSVAIFFVDPCRKIFQTRSNFSGLPLPDPPFQECKKHLGFVWSLRRRNPLKTLHAKPRGVGQGQVFNPDFFSRKNFSNRKKCEQKVTVWLLPGNQIRFRKKQEPYCAVLFASSLAAMMKSFRVRPPAG